MPVPIGMRRPTKPVMGLIDAPLTRAELKERAARMLPEGGLWRGRPTRNRVQFTNDESALKDVVVDDLHY